MGDGKAAFARRLNEAFDRLEIPPKQRGRFTALSRLFGVSAVAARDWCEGNSYPSVDKLLVIMDTVRCGADWLLYGRGPDGRSQPTAAAQTMALEGADAVAASAASVQAEPGSATLHWLTVTGDAMAPRLRAGDQVGYRPVVPAPLSDGLHVLLAAGANHSAGPDSPQPVLRRCHQRLDGTVELGCDNPLYPERERYRQSASGQLLPAHSGEPALQVLGRVIALRTGVD